MAVSLAFAPACGDESEGDDEGSGSSTGSSSSANADCKSLREPTILVDAISANAFELDGDELFFVDPEARALMKYPAKGGAGTTLVQFDATQRAGEGILVDGDDVFFLLGNATDSKTNLTLHRVSRSGGAPAKLLATGTSAVPSGLTFFGSDATSVYTSDYDTFIARFNKATGVGEYVIKGFPDLASPHLYEGKIYFSDVETGNVLSVDAGAIEGTGQVVLEEACMISYDLSISPARIGCGLDVWNWQGMKTNFLDTSGRLTPPFHGGVFGFSQINDTISQVRFDPFESQVLACDVGSGLNAIRASKSDVYFINIRSTSKGNVRSISRVPRAWPG